MLSKGKAPVSVVIPCYRCSATIGRAVESVACQTLPPFEIVCVDDGSGDDTLQRLKLLQSRYDREWIKIVPLERNSGVSVARNTGWNTAKGAYVAFLDSDDAWHPEKIAIQYNWMTAHPEVALSGHMFRIVTGSDQDVIPVDINVTTAETISKSKILFSNPFVTPSVMARRKLTNRFNPNRRYMEDYLLWMEICCDGHATAKLDLPLVNLYKRCGEAGLSSHTWRMRQNDMTNYWQLWRSDRIHCLQMAGCITFSFLKGIVRIGWRP